MALVYAAQLNPTKIELIRNWIVDQPWFAGAEFAGAELEGTEFEGAEFAGPGSEVDLVALGAYRFDDPADEVGIETHLVRVGEGATHQVPLTYRAAELPGAENALVGTTDHSVLGKRWVYDAVSDPLYVQQLATAILAGGTEASAFTPEGDPIEPTMTVQGSGTVEDVPALEADLTVHSARGLTTITAGPLTVRVLRVLGSGSDTSDMGPGSDGEVLVGTFADGTVAGPLAFAHTR